MKRETIERLWERKFRRMRRRNSLFNRKGPSKRFIGLAAIVAALVALFTVVKGGHGRHPGSSSIPDAGLGATLPAPKALSPGVTIPSLQEVKSVPASHQRTIEATVKKGDNLFDILLREGIPASRIHELVAAARPVHNLARLQQDQTFTLDFDKRDGKVLRFQTAVDAEHRLVVEPDGEELRAREEALDFEILHRVVSGTIHDSLFLAADEAGLSPVLTLALAEIFAWDIDFHVDMRKGDTFQVLFEKKYLDGRFAHLGRILAAVIVNRGDPFWAFHFEYPDGRSDYYDQEGRSLRKAFLKSPLKYSRISSRFSYRRFHPILKIYRPHLGVDYAAPLGTPVLAVGDGRVVVAKWKSGYGRFVEIRHNEAFASTYGHLRSFAKGIKRGEYVSQGQVIGYVGTTGLSTGPHLDFRLLKNCRFINPLKVNFPDADPVCEEDMPEFRRRVEQFLSELEGEDSIRKISAPSIPGNEFADHRAKS